MLFFRILFSFLNRFELYIFVLGEVHKFFLNIWNWSVVLEILNKNNSEKRASSQAPFQGLER